MNRDQFIHKMMTEPEALIQISREFLKEDRRYGFVRVLSTNVRAGFRAGDFALIDIDGPIEPDDTVLTCDAAGSMCILVLQKTDRGWTLAPLKGSRLLPIFLANDKERDDLLIGRVAGYFNMRAVTAPGPEADG